MAKLLVTVVGFSVKNPGFSRTEVGTTLVFRKDHINDHDPDAITVELEDGDSVGFVSNRETTIAPGTKSATEVKSSFDVEAKGIVVNETTVQMTTKTGATRNNKVFVVELLVDATKQGESTVKKEFVFKLVGANTLYPHKTKLIKEMENGIKPFVTLKKVDNKVVAEFEGGLAGYVDSRNQDGVTPFEELLPFVENERTAQITEKISMNFIGRFSVSEADLAKEKAVYTLKSKVKEIIDAGLSTKEEMEEKISYMESYGVTEKQMLGMFGTYKAYTPEIASLIPNKPKTLYQDGSGLLKRVIGYGNMQRNMMFEGDKGVGKNVLTETLGWLYNRPLFETSLNSQYTNNDLLGGKTFETNEEGKTMMGFDKEAIVQAAEHGGICVLDEINTSLSHVMSVMNSLLDDRRRITVPGYKQFNADSNFFVIGTMNPNYQGTFELNEATADRFIPILFPPLTSIKETLVAKVPDVSLSIIDKCEQLYKDIKGAVGKGRISEQAITIRGFVDACLATQADVPLKNALIDNVANRANDKEDRKSIATFIDLL